MANFESVDKFGNVIGRCHDWRLKAYTRDTYVCFECRQEVQDFDKADPCRLMSVPKGWLPQIVCDAVNELEKAVTQTSTTKGK